MSNKDIFNFEENVKEFIDESNKLDVTSIVDEFKRGHFPNVLSKTKEFREKYDPSENLERLLLLVDAICHTQIGENRQASDIIQSIYEHSNKERVYDLILYGNLAFMCDYKLSRKIMSDVVKRIESEAEIAWEKVAHSYLVLGEAEEKLHKYKRAIKYYKRGILYSQKVDMRDEQMMVFLHFKLGGLHSMINEKDEAIRYLQKTIDLAGDSHDEIKINSLVSLARMYGSINEHNKAISCLKEVIPMLEDSPLANKLVHAEAYTEMAYNYYDQSELDEAVSFYEKAISIHLRNPHYSPRELGMIYMQYAYCLEHKESPNKIQAGKNYEKAIEELERTKDQELLENALADVIAFFESTKNQKKKRHYENKFLNLANQKAQ